MFENVTLELLPIITKIIVILIVGVVIGKSVKKLFSKLLKKINIDYFISEKFRVSHIISTLIEWSIYVMFLQILFKEMGIIVISDIFGIIVDYLPNLIESVVVITIALVIVQFLKGYMHKYEFEHKEYFISIATFFILYIAIATIMSILGINSFLIDTALLLIAFGSGIIIIISLGMGLRSIMVNRFEWIQPYIKRWVINVRKNSGNN